MRNRFLSSNWFFFTIILVLLSASCFAQPSGMCSSTTPFFTVDLTGQPAGTWTSAGVIRKGFCCGATGNDVCIEFKLTLDTGTASINFQIVEGAIPAGALYYKINCGPPIKVGEPICISGPGPHVITFCKPGNNQNVYAITAIPKPRGSGDVTTSDGCKVTMGSMGLNLSSITWNSVYPGSYGQYNNYLSCTAACETTVVTPQPGYPPYIDYVLCGTPISVCSNVGTFCDTVRAYFVPPLANSINPNPASFCATNPSVLLTGVMNGGAPPYTILWYNQPNGGGTQVGSGETYTATAIGTYSMVVRDATYPACPQKITDVTVTQQNPPIVNAGADRLICPGNPNVVLAGSVTNATGGVWTGGSGTFTPNASTLNATYTPSAAEISAGSVTLTLTSTGNGACSSVSDQMVITITKPLQVSVTPNIVCFGEKATVTANVTGGTQPYSFAWNTGATTQSLSNMPPGTYTVTVTDATPNACKVTASNTVKENPQVVVSLPSNTIISCDSSVAITVNASGGAGGSYNFLWSTGATSTSIVINTGTYWIQASDNLGCKGYDTITINAANSALAASIAPPPVLCFGTNTTLNASAVGGFGGYTYTWTTGQVASSITAGAGNYCVTAEDTVGCLNTACIEVKENPKLEVTIPTPPKVCFGATTAITANVTGGVAPYTYTWTGGSETTASVVRGAGSWTVTVRDANGTTCSASTTTVISQATVLTATNTVNNVSCFGGTNGSITMIPAGSQSPYSYSWSANANNANTATVLGLAAGTYSVTIKDALNCQLTQTVTITEPPLLEVAFSPLQHASCFGFKDGSATASVTGGTPGYSYTWIPNVSTTNEASGLGAGPISVSIKDTKGCTVTRTDTIKQPAVLGTAVGSVTHVLCNGDQTGAASVTASGGTPGYSYYWVTEGYTTNSASSLYAGTYSINVQDAQGCSTTVKVTINQPPPLEISVASSQNVSCFGLSNASIDVDVEGGTPGYSYTWTNNVSTSDVASNIPAGTYSVDVKDANNCVISITQAITEPTALKFSSATTVKTKCFGSCDGQASITASGGTTGYTYLWSNNATTSSVNGLCAGSYSVRVTDGNGCTIDTTLIVEEPTEVLLTASAMPAHCNKIDGTVNASATGGTGTFTFTWNNSLSGPKHTVGAGTHTIVVRDGNNCTKTTSVVVDNIPAPVATVVADQMVSCNAACNGAATVTATGGTGAYTYLWNTSPQQNTATATSLCAGTWSAIVTDSAGCKDTAAVIITQPDALVATIAASSNVSCFGYSDASIDIDVTGGTPLYTYEWSPLVSTFDQAFNLAAGTYNIKVTDSNGCSTTVSKTITQPTALSFGSPTTTIAEKCFGSCDGQAQVTVLGGTPGTGYTYQWSTGGTTSTITGVCAGSVNVTVKDSKGCTKDTSMIVGGPSDLVLSTTTETAHCGQADGSATVTATGGNAGNYSYEWNTSPKQFLPKAGNVAPGTYTVTVRDSKGCVKTATATIGNVEQPEATTSLLQNVSCFNACDGSALVTATGGTGSYTYKWLTSVIQSKDTATKLCAGTWNVVVTDQYGCDDTASVTITQPPALLVAVNSSSDITCFGYVNGVIELGVTGGTPTYSYNWSGLVSNNNIATNLAAGTYTVTVTDKNGCATTITKEIKEPSKFLFVNGAGFQTSCYSKCDGSAIVLPGGGTGEYTYSWSTGYMGTGTSFALLKDVCTGFYSVTVQDENNCQIDTVLEVKQPEDITIVFTTDSANCGLPTGKASAVASGGNGNYSYLWSNNISGATASNLPAGTISVTVTDGKGCKKTSSVIIPDKPGIKASATLLNDAKCKSSCDGSARADGLNGTGMYTYKWLTPTVQGSQTVSNLCAGTHSVVVTDSNGCFDTAKVEIKEPSVITAVAGAEQTICVGGTATLTASASGGWGNSFTYTWSNGQQGSSVNVSPVVSTTYTVVCTDANNCSSAPATITVKVRDNLSVAGATGNDICEGGVATLTAEGKGGDGFYTYTWTPGNFTGPTVFVSPSAATAYTVTITDLCGSPAATQVVNVGVYPNPTAYLTVSGASGCAPLCVNFENLTVLNSGTVIGWNWDFGDGSFSNEKTPSKCYSNAGQFSVSLVAVSDKGCKDTLSFGNFITVNPSPTADFAYSPTSISSMYPVVTFEDRSIDAVSWVWDFADPRDSLRSILQNPQHTYSDSGDYCPKLIVTNSVGCRDTMIQCLRVKPEHTFYVPNAFSPDDNPHNPTFNGVGTNIIQYEMMIFNRWGELIFITNNIDDPWRGDIMGSSEPAPQGVYAYKIRYKDITNKWHDVNGHVTLLR